MEVAQYDSQYLPGTHNHAIRYYFYLTKGLEVLNLFRNLFLGILAIYIALKWDNVLLLPALLIPSLVVLTIAGYYAVHHMSKVTEWLNMRFGTHYGINSYNLSQEQNHLLKEIRDLLQKHDLHH